MRKLITSDLSSICKIVKKMNIKNEIKALTQDITNMKPEEKTKVEQSMKIDLCMIFVENYPNADKEVYKLIADISEKTVNEIEIMPIKQFFDLVKEIMSQEGAGDFLSLALK